MKRSLMSLCTIALYCFCSFLEADNRLTRDIVIETNEQLKFSICTPTFLGQEDIGTNGLIITLPGVYKLKEDIIFMPTLTSNAITIDTDNVLLDLQCYAIRQTNTLPNSHGIELTAGHTNVIIQNGSINNFTGNGIKINNDSSICTLADLTFSQCDRGIFFDGSLLDPITKCFITGCDFILNSSGVSFNWVHSSQVQNCSALMSNHAGFDILNSFNNKFTNCQAVQTLSMDNNAFGFFVDKGSKNIFKELCIDATTSLATLTNTTATGFFIGPDESKLILEQSQISNSTTTSQGQPFGIQMQYSFTSLNSDSLPTLTFGNFTRRVQWSPNGRFLAIAGEDADSNGKIEIFEFDGEFLTLVSTVIRTERILSIDWNPTNEYLAIGGDAVGSIDIEIFAFNGSSLQLDATFSHGTSAFSVDWSPDGRFLAIGGDDNPGLEIRVLKFDNFSLSQVASFTHGRTIAATNWSPDGRYLAIGGAHSSGADVQVLEFIEGRMLSSIATFSHGIDVFSTNWHPSGRFLAISGSPTNGVNTEVLSFNGSSLTSIITLTITPFFAPEALWSPDGKLLAVASLGTDEVEVFSFDEVALSSITTFTHGAGVFSVDWSPTGIFLALGGLPNPVTSIDTRILTALQFPQQCLIANNQVSNINGPSLPNGQPGIPSGRGISSSAGNNLIMKNTAFDNDLNYVFATDIYQKFIVNRIKDQPSTIDNLSFPPL